MIENDESKDEIIENEIIDGIKRKKEAENSSYQSLTMSLSLDKKSFAQYFKPKNWCDAKDELNVWRLGKIKEISGSFVLVTFDGWSEKWNKWYCIHSDDILPLRFETVGYTGQKTIALREFDFDSRMIETATSKLKLLTANENLTGFSAFDLTSFIRGDLFVLVDSIMTNGNNLETKDIAIIFQQFFIQIILFALKWMSVTKKNVLMNQIVSTDQESYLKYQPYACFKCGSELTLMLKSIFGYEKRTQSFYEINNFSTSPKGLISMFLNNSGLQYLTELIELNVQKTLKIFPKIDFFLLWPLIYCIPFFFESNTSYNSYYPGQIKNFLSTFNIYIKMNLEDHLIRPEFFENEEFKEFYKSLRKLSHNYLNECSIDKIFEEFRIPVEKEALAMKQKSLNQFIDMKKLQTHENLAFSKDLMNLKSSLCHDSKRTSLNIIPQKTATDNYKNLEKEIENLKNQINSLQQQNKKEKETKIYPIPEVENQLKFLTKFNEIIENRLFIKKSNNPLIELENGNEDAQELGAEVKEIIDEQKNNKKGINENAILNAAEMLISQNKIEESLKLIRWRKNILKLINICGLEVGNEIAKRTLKKMNVDIDDIILANLEIAVGDDDNFLSYFIEKKEDKEI